MTGCFPFWDKQHAKLYEKIRKVQYGWPAASPISPAAKHLVSQLLVRDPNRRLNAEQCMAHPWVSGTGMSKLRRVDSYKKLASEDKAARKARREERRRRKEARSGSKEQH